MSTTPTLWRLQVIDQELDDKSKRARQVAEALANDPNVTAAHAALNAEQKQLSAARAALRDRELDAAGLDAKIKELDARLYGGHVTNPKELDGLEKDLQMHKRHRSELDDTLLALMETVDQAQKRVDEKTTTLNKIEGARADDLERLERERQALAARLAALEAEGDKTRAALDADAMRQYEFLKRTKAGRAVAQIKNASCGVCGVAVPTGLVNRVRTGDEIILCSSCGRILA